VLRKRIVGVITVRGGWAVQSFAYGRYLPLGRPEILAKNLDRWGADEILLQCIDRSRALGPDIALLQRVASKGITTPLIYAGGIRNSDDGRDVIHAGADRIAVDSMLWDNRDAVSELEARLGAQAVIAALPLSIEANGLMHYNYRTKAQAPLAEELLDFLRRRVVSEVLVIDWKGEGGLTFDTRLLDAFPVPDMPIIGFGGLAGADQLRGVLTRPNVVAAAVGNALNYREHTVRLLKQALGDLPLRAPSHQRWTEHG
jgi:imidazole glycerol-phosphate synthase subunit HisF